MDIELVKRWYEQYKTGIFRYTLSITHDPYLAEDILQDTFVQLIVKGLRPDPGKEQAWLYKVARNKSYDALKRNKHMEELSQQTSVNLEQNLEFFDMIATLNAKEQEIVTLKIVCGFSHREIASIIGVSVPATKKRYERAIQKLREEMGDV